MGTREDHRGGEGAAAGALLQHLTPPVVPERFLELPRDRVTRWVEGFLDAHGPVSATPSATGVELAADDGAWASLDLWFRPPDPPVPGSSGAWRAASALVTAAVAAPPMLVVAVRRGGWAVGLVADGAERAGKAGRSYVQSRTSKGGSSQGRYARRRAGQAAGLVADATDRVRLLVADPGMSGDVRAVLVAGDRSLWRRVLDDAGVDLDVVGPFDVGDPRRATIAELAERVRGVRVRVRDPRTRGRRPGDRARP